jgi:hypothetical protein
LGAGGDGGLLLKPDCANTRDGKMKLKSYLRGFSIGLVLGIVWLFWVYWRAEQFPGDPALNRYYAWLRRLDVG